VELLLWLLLIVVLVVIGVWLFIARQGDAEFEFLVEQRTDAVLKELTADTATFSCTVPFVNKGTQDGTIMDCYPRHLLPQEQYDAVETKSWLALESSPRDDGYFEALIVPKTTGSAVVVTVKFTAKQGDIKQALADMVDLSVDIVFQVVARGTWYISKQRMIIRASELASAINAGLASA
jgi:hypothetical protein